MNEVLVILLVVSKAVDIAWANTAKFTAFDVCMSRWFRAFLVWCALQYTWFASTILVHCRLHCTIIAKMMHKTNRVHVHFYSLMKVKNNFNRIRVYIFVLQMFVLNAAMQSNTNTSKQNEVNCCLLNIRGSSIPNEFRCEFPLTA